MALIGFKKLTGGGEEVDGVYIIYTLKKDKSLVNQNVSMSHLQGWMVGNFNLFLGVLLYFPTFLQEAVYFYT